MKTLFALLLLIIIGTGSAIFSQTVSIGTQVWMTKNLDVSTFRNGDPIPQAKTNKEWVKAGKNKQPAWCYYKNKKKNGKKYGKLYNWHAVNDPRGLAPAGYHIPSDTEWTILSDYLGGDAVAGSKMKSTSGWAKNGNGTNSSGFSGLPGGDRNGNGNFGSSGNDGYWWSSTEYDTDFAYSRPLNHSSGSLNRYGSSKEGGLSVRCLRD
jgi:uncharacterized protein (TIGR02145 family)